ncbi:MAG: hypothetical protein HOK52_12475 [Candidatus Marinimicrobia bacterium]|jgi:hypothetical protein|nr:hypothetical protein [Candidatus Neomarinimicrobiota bacterium]MBT3937188.1 hypothetical protein [Candidatus Neomarinimicrobiota bacterium]MBT3960860.1 hypothetical protein [Candidatus Neomarinimicrobiota bacterium]MBT4383552.1 hypothetical protein [Candidatus Neomarinimicrobiota bacterium]MBT4636852.1 hypothetical protein [Candidatus Neomarinimicrobiota bacterium]
MNPINLYFDVRDIFRAPRLALSGKKIWIFLIGNLAGFVLYWIFTYIALAAAGVPFSNAIATYGLYPCLYGVDAPWFAWALYYIGSLGWIAFLHLSCTAVARVTLKQLKGDNFFSAGDAWNYVNKHWHPVIFTSISIVLILGFFLLFAGIFALFGKIPYVGEYLFALPYLFYFLGSVFTVYTAFVLVISCIYTPAIVGAYEEDTMGSVFQSYSIAWSQPWRVVLYNIVLLPLAWWSLKLFSWFMFAGFQLVNHVFGMSFLMGEKATSIVGNALNFVIPRGLCESICAPFSCSGALCGTPCSFYTLPEAGSLSGSEMGASIIVGLFLLLILFSIVSYGLSILSVGETLMFIIFKKKSDDDDLIERKDEDELEEDDEDDFSFDDDGEESESDSNDEDANTDNSEEE